jgi:hypothetical protein
MSASGTSTSVTAPELEIPCDKIMATAARIAIQEDKPIMLDYYCDTRDGRAFLGEDSATKEKMLVRSDQEYTSPISKIFKVGEDYIVLTENSIYIASKNIRKRNITTPTA